MEKRKKKKEWNKSKQKTKHMRSPPLCLYIRKLFSPPLKPDLEAFSWSSFCPHWFGPEAFRLHWVQTGDIRGEKMVSSLHVQWYFIFMPSSPTFLFRFTFQSPQVWEPCILSRLIATFSRKDRLGFAHSILLGTRNFLKQLCYKKIIWITVF